MTTPFPKGVETQRLRNTDLEEACHPGILHTDISHPSSLPLLPQTQQGQTTMPKFPLQTPQRYPMQCLQTPQPYPMQCLQTPPPMQCPFSGLCHSPDRGTTVALPKLMVLLTAESCMPSVSKIPSLGEKEPTSTPPSALHSQSQVGFHLGSL